MKDFEADVIDRLGRIETMLNADFRAIHGNGKPGLVDKVDLLETRVDRIEDRHQVSDKARNRKLEWFAILSSAAGTLYAIFMK